MLNLNLPATWAKNDALYLTAYGPHQEELFTWSWAINLPAAMAEAPMTKSGIKANDTGNELVIICDGIKYYFDKSTGYIEKVAQHYYLQEHLFPWPDAAFAGTYF